MRSLRARPLRILIAVALAWAVLACRSGGRKPLPPQPASDAPGAALELFRAAREGASAAELAPLLDGDLTGAPRASMEALVEEIRGTTSAAIVGEEPAGDRTAVDLEATLRGGGTARYHLQARAAGGSWRVVSVVGPGASWPPVKAPGGDGLSTSAPPSPPAL